MPGEWWVIYAFLDATTFITFIKTQIISFVEKVNLELLIETNMISLESLHFFSWCVQRKKNSKIIKINQGFHTISWSSHEWIANCLSTCACFSCAEAVWVILQHQRHRDISKLLLFRSWWCMCCNRQNVMCSRGLWSNVKWKPCGVWSSFFHCC